MNKQPSPAAEHARQKWQTVELTNAILESVQGMPVSVVLSALLSGAAQTIRIIPDATIRAACIAHMRKMVEQLERAANDGT